VTLGDEISTRLRVWKVDVVFDETWTVLRSESRYLISLQLQKSHDEMKSMTFEAQHAQRCLASCDLKNRIDCVQPLSPSSGRT
jgi:hypothetical protein